MANEEKKRIRNRDGQIIHQAFWNKVAKMLTRQLANCIKIRVKTCRLHYKLHVNISCNPFSDLAHHPKTKRFSTQFIAHSCRRYYYFNAFNWCKHDLTFSISTFSVEWCHFVDICRKIDFIKNKPHHHHADDQLWASINAWWIQKIEFQISTVIFQFWILSIIICRTSTSIQAKSRNLFASRFLITLIHMLWCNMKNIDR